MNERMETGASILRDSHSMLRKEASRLRALREKFDKLDEAGVTREGCCPVTSRNAGILNARRLFQKRQRSICCFSRDAFFQMLKLLGAENRHKPPLSADG